MVRATQGTTLDSRSGHIPDHGSGLACPTGQHKQETLTLQQGALILQKRLPIQ